jgi:eukaryotic-like serine/threonine-protein kinase
MPRPASSGGEHPPGVMRSPSPRQHLPAQTPVPEATAPPASDTVVTPVQELNPSGHNFLAPPQAPDELGRLGPYRILKLLAKGGMGFVFQAEDPRLGRLCALKTMLPEMAQRPDMKERFLREARAAAQLEHDHIIPIYQVDEDRGVPYIAMPFLKGASLEEWYKQKKKDQPGTPLAEPQILKLGREIARGLAAAHKKGFVHRDIKPANIWLDASAGGRVRILDFGLARLSDNTTNPNLTQSGTIIGTPAYMAPEQALGKNVDGRADLFSLGVVLYRLCTGKMPFRGETSMAVMAAAATVDPPPPDAINPSVSPALSALVMQLLVKDPQQRLESAKEVVQIIQAIEKSPSSGSSARLPKPASQSGGGSASTSSWKKFTDDASPAAVRKSFDKSSKSARIAKPSAARKALLRWKWPIAVGTAVLLVGFAFSALLWLISQRP